MLKLAGFSFSVTMEYAKPLFCADQAALLIERGLVVSDPNVLMRQLEAVGYYRLCAYWHPFKQVDSSFGRRAGCWVYNCFDPGRPQWKFRFLSRSCTCRHHAKRVGEKGNPN